MSNIVTLKSFPFDSMEKLNEESGQMEDDRLYEAEIFRKYFAKFLSNGVYYGHYKNYGENSMKVSLNSGLTIKVAKGAGIIEGADYELENNAFFTLERPASGSRKDRVVVRFDKTLAERNTYLLIKEGNGTTASALQRDDNIYEICIAEVTVRSATNITANDIKDTRLDKNLCGIVNSLISVDGNELYMQFQGYIDTVTDNLVRKDQNSIINGNIIVNSIKDKNNKGLSTNDFTTLLKNTIENNKTTIDSLKDTIKTNEATINLLKNTIKTNETTINSLRNTVETDKTTINSLKITVNSLKNTVETNKIVIKRGTSAPSGGSNGDIYLQYFN